MSSWGEPSAHPPPSAHPGPSASSAWAAPPPHGSAPTYASQPWAQQQQQYQQQQAAWGSQWGQQPPPPPHAGLGATQIVAPKIEMQPWAKDLMNWLGTHTTGVARVDLRRPTAPPSDQYVEGNILLAHKPPNRSWNPRGGRRQQAPQPDYQAWERRPQRQTGARIKITRNVLMFKDPEGLRKPLLDVGMGLAVNMDSTRIEPVLRAKIGDLVSIKAFPLGIIKISKSLPIANTGMSAKLLYELPLNHLHTFWKPPARLMVRLDTSAGSGLHLSPTGVEFDEKLMHFSERLSVRAAIGFAFPRSLPVDWDNDDIGFKVHRLSLKTLW